MQKREGVHRRRRGRRRPLIIVSLVAIGALRPIPGAALAEGVWLCARGGAAVPGEGLYPGDPGGGARSIVAVSSCAQPYGLEHCRRAALGIGYRQRTFGFILDWDLLHHPLYREDRLSLELRAAASSGRLIAAVRPGLRRCGIPGFSPERGRTCVLSCACAPGAGVRIGFEWSVAPPDGRAPSFVTAAVSIDADRFRFIANRLFGGSRSGDGRIGVEVELGCGVTLLSGYHLGNDEIAAGIAYRTERYLFGMSWSDHESLGTTFTFGLGRMWRL